MNNIYIQSRATIAEVSELFVDPRTTLKLTFTGFSEAGDGARPNRFVLLKHVLNYELV